MSRQEKFDTPDWMISTGEYLQIFPRFLGATGLAKLVVGSKSPAYSQARWYTADQVVDETEENAQLPIVEADQDARLRTIIPRFKKRAAVVSAGRWTMDAILDRHLARPAVAYTYAGTTHAGVLPAKSLGLEYIEETEKWIDTAGLRIGRNPLGVGLGAWVPSERTIVLPGDLKIIESNILIDDLSESFPHTPLV